MDLLALLRKETLAVRGNIGLFVVLLILIPGALVAGTVVYERTIPRDVPVGVVAADETTTDDDIAITRAGVTFFATPVSYEDPELVEDALLREEVYFAIVVPANITEEGNDVTFTVISDQTIVPFQEPANITVSVMSGQLDRSLPAHVTVEHKRLGVKRELSEYLVPTGLLAFLVLYALIFLPYQVRGERLVLDRLQTESRLDLVVASKLLFYGALLIVSAVTVGLVTAALGYDIAALAPMTLGVLLLTFVFLGAIGLAVLFVFKLGSAGVFVNLGLALGIFSLSSFVYPVGFFSEIRKEIARSLPTHYSMISLRSAMLRDAPVTLYTDYLVWLGATAVLSVVVLKLAVVSYRRRQQ